MSRQVTFLILRLFPDNFSRANTSNRGSRVTMYKLIKYLNDYYPDMSYKHLIINPPIFIKLALSLVFTILPQRSRLVNFILHILSCRRLIHDIKNVVQCRTITQTFYVYCICSNNALAPSCKYQLVQR